MLNGYGKSLFKPWCSVQNLVLVLSLVFLALVLIRSYNLNSGEVASWVQAIGAIVSIWAAWSIAGSQGRRASREARRQELARCAGVIGILKHIESVIDSSFGKDNEAINVSSIKEDITTLVNTLDRIDLMSLPSATFVDAVCEVRQKVEAVLAEFRDPLRAIRFGLHARFNLAGPIFKVIEKHVALCEAEIQRIQSDAVA